MCKLGVKNININVSCCSCIQISREAEVYTNRSVIELSKNYGTDLKFTHSYANLDLF